MRCRRDGAGLNRGRRDVSVLFLDASDETILRRFSETRRPHPLSSETTQGASAVIDGIRRERDLLAALRARATLVLDTTRLSVHDLRRAIVGRFGPAGGRMPRLRIRVVSFGYKFGSPVDADLLFDVRFLPNPHFVDELRAVGYPVLTIDQDYGVSLVQPRMGGNALVPSKSKST